MNKSEMVKAEKMHGILKPIAFVFIASLAMAHSACSQRGQDLPPSERPMYGGVSPTSAIQKVDQQFIAEEVRKYGSREAASEQALRIAWQCFDKGDYRTAMRRFNQAWLINPDDSRIYHGYGATLGEMGQPAAFVKWNKKSAEMGWGNAQVNMGWAYLIGFGVQANSKEAVRWYEKAANQGHPTGLNNLGVLYDWGYGVERDAEKAKLLYERADQAGFKGDWKKLRRNDFLQENPEDKDVNFQQIVDVLRKGYFAARKERMKNQPAL